MSTTEESGPEKGATPSAEPDPAPHPSPEAALNTTTTVRAGNGCSIDPNGVPKP